jgi:predicted DNA binding protein
MIAVADLSVPASEFVFRETLPAHPSVELELLEFAPTGEHPTSHCWIAGRDRDVAAFAGAIGESPRIDAITPLDHRRERVLYRIEWVELPGPLADALGDYEIGFQRARGSADGWHLRLQCPDRGTLSAIQQEAIDAAVDATVDRVYRPDAVEEPGTASLTPAQREAIVLARREGYFDVPRGITLEELGSTLGVSRQAVSNRLRRGTRELVDRVVLPGAPDPPQ